MNLSLLLDMAADGLADRVLVGRRADGLTGADLRRRSIGGARALAHVEATALVYLGVNGASFPVSLFAAARIGVPLVPLNYRLGDDQLAQLLARHPGALAVTDPGQLDRVRRLGVDAITAMTIADWMDRTADLAGDEFEASDGADTAVVIYTSGTTSVPKGVVIKHANLLAYVFGSVEFASADESDAALISVPPYHIAAVANAVTNLYAGRRCVVLEQFTATEWLDVVRAEHITNALVVPTMLARILSPDSVGRPDSADSSDLTVPSLRTLAYGGAAMPLPVIERALRTWPDVEFVNAYGLTETSSTIAVLGPDEHRAAVASDDPAARARLASVGRVVPSVELQVRDEDGHVLGVGSPGRIWVRGEQVSGEYSESGSVLDADGFFDTRDVGYLDAEGYLFIRGRADDTIIRGGENIAPAEIEDVLLAHPDVLDAVVVGVPDEEWGQRIEAAVVLRAAAAAGGDALRDHVRAQLRGSKTPDRIVVWDELPRTETGKLIRREAVARIVSAEPVSAEPVRT
jgi:acyl-CoA synthetase (AMP-forming)/AMP-acid ligase II